MDGQQAQQLVERYADMILRISFSYLKQTCDAEDICQTVFLKYLTKHPEFDTAEHEKAWIIRTTINACKDCLRSAYARQTVPLEEADYLAAPQAAEDDMLEALKSLPDKYRVPIYLFYYEEYSAREIAHIMGKSESNVTTYLSRGRRLLRKYLETEGATLYGA